MSDICKQCGHPGHGAYCNVVCRCVGRMYGEGFPTQHEPVPHAPYPAANHEMALRLQGIESQNAKMRELLRRARDHMTNDGFAFEVKRDIDAALTEAPAPQGGKEE